MMAHADTGHLTAGPVPTSYRTEPPPTDFWGSVGRILLRLICNLCINISAASTGSASGRMCPTTRHSRLSIDFEQRNRFRFIWIKHVSLLEPKPAERRE